MPFLPLLQETIVLPLEASAVTKKLKRVTRPVEKGIEFPEEVEQTFLFNGIIKKNRFRISRKISHPENFLPLMVGHVESTSLGSILFVRYRLFFGAVLLLTFWSVISVLLAIFFLFLHKEYLYATITLALGIGNYIVALKNFHIQVKISKKILDSALNFR